MSKNGELIRCGAGGVLSMRPPRCGEMRWKPAGKQLVGLAITFGIAGVLAWLLVSTGSESDPKPPPVGTARGGNFWVTTDEERQNAFKQITKRIDLDASLPKSTPQGFVLRQIGQGQATAFEQVILDYYAPDLVPPPSPTPLPGDARHVQVRVMHRERRCSRGRSSPGVFWSGREVAFRGRIWWRSFGRWPSDPRSIRTVTGMGPGRDIWRDTKA